MKPTDNNLSSIQCSPMNADSERTDTPSALLEKRKALEELDGMIRPVPGLDYDEELASHRDIKYDSGK